MDNLGELNPLEKVFLFIQPLLSGAGTAAGVTFPSLFIFSTFLKLKDTPLITFSYITGAFFILGLASIVFYFFKKNLNQLENNLYQLQKKQMTLQKVLTNFVINTKKVALTQTNFQSIQNLQDLNISTEDSSPRGKLLIEIMNGLDSYLIAHQITNMGDLEGKRAAGPLETEFLKEGSIKYAYHNFEASLLSPSYKNAAFISLPSMVGFMSLFVAYGSILGAFAGVAGTLINMKWVDNLYNIGTPILLTALLFTIVASSLNGLLTYNAEKRNMEREKLFLALNKQIKKAKQANKSLITFLDNQITNTDENSSLNRFSYDPSPSRNKLFSSIKKDQQSEAIPILMSETDEAFLNNTAFWTPISQASSLLASDQGSEEKSGFSPQ